MSLGSTATGNGNAATMTDITSTSDSTIIKDRSAATLTNIDLNKSVPETADAAPADTGVTGPSVPPRQQLPSNSVDRTDDSNESVHGGAFGDTSNGDAASDASDVGDFSEVVYQLVGDWDI